MYRIILAITLFIFFIKIYGNTFWKSNKKRILVLKYKFSLKETDLNFPFQVITTNKDSKYYIFDNNNLKIFNSSGELLPIKFPKGRSPEENILMRSGDFDESNNYLYILDSQNRKIMIYDAKDYSFKKMIGLYNLNVKDIFYTNYKEKKGLLLNVVPCKLNDSYLYFLEINTGKLEPIKNAKVKLVKEDDLYLYHFIASLFDKKVALLRPRLKKEMVIYDLENDKEKIVKLKNIVAKDKTIKNYWCCECISQASNFVFFGTDMKRFYSFDNDYNLQEVDLKFDKEEFKKEYDFCCENETIENNYSKNFFTNYVIFLNKYSKEAIVIVNRTTVRIFSYEFK